MKKIKWVIVRCLLRLALRLAPDGNASCDLEDMLRDLSARHTVFR